MTLGLHEYVDRLLRSLGQSEVSAYLHYEGLGDWYYSMNKVLAPLMSCGFGPNYKTHSGTIWGSYLNLLLDHGPQRPMEMSVQGVALLIAHGADLSAKVLVPGYEVNREEDTIEVSAYRVVKILHPEHCKDLLSKVPASARVRWYWAAFVEAIKASKGVSVKSLSHSRGRRGPIHFYSDTSETDEEEDSSMVVEEEGNSMAEEVEDE